MKRQKYTTHTSFARAVQKRIAGFVFDAVSPLIKVTRSGKRYVAIPLPNRSALTRFGIIILVIATISFLGYQCYRLFGPHSYAVDSVSSLLPAPNPALKDSIAFDSKNRVYNFSAGVSVSDTAKQTTSTPVTATLASDARKGITVTDPTYKVDLGMTPRFSLVEGKQTDDARIVYPFRDHSGWLVYTAQNTGVKEDIVLRSENGDVRTFDYTLTLPSGTEARLENDGSVGIYGNDIFMSNVTVTNDADAALLEKARARADKTLLLFTIPKPVIVEAKPSNAAIKAAYELKGSQLRVTVSGLAKANYPLSIDPSIYVVTAQQFMNGNNETNIDFDVDNKVIKKGATTGARFDNWSPTLSMNATKWKQGVAVAGGYIYTVGGVHPEGGLVTFTSAGSSTFTVPSGVTSITIKAWGAGGGGGGGGGAAAGGAGGAGGYAISTLSVTSGETLNVYVGGGGSGGSGGTGTNTSGAGGSGGGYSRIARGSTSLLIAGGGAGGGGGGRSSGYTGGAGGAGGGTAGQNGIAGTNTGGGYGSGANGATGGASNTPGANTGTAGSSLQGGAGADGRSSQGVDGSGVSGGTNGGGDGGSRDVAKYYAGAGGGGGGYAGGGGGSDNGTSSRGAGGGGGGSSYVTGTGSTIAGSYTTPGNDGDADQAGAGAAGSGGASRTSGTAGGSGIVVITYVSDTGATDTVSWAKFNTANGTIESANPGNGACSGWCTSTLYNLPSPRGKFSLIAYNGFLYALGGEDETCTSANGTGDNGICKTVYVAKIGANGEPQLWHPTDSNKANWTYWYRDADLSSPRSSIKAVAYNNRLYLMGGLTSSGGSTSVTNTVQIADLTPDGRLGNWNSSTTLPYNAYGYSAVAYNDRLYILGGANTVGGSPIANVYYNKINANGSLNTWQATTSMPNGRMSSGGDFSSVWGAYLYISGGCLATNANGYCTSIADSTQLTSINADGTIDIWNTNGGVSDTRLGHSLIAWRNYLYEVGGCSNQNPTTGSCNTALSDIQYGKINPDGEASTVANSVNSGTSPCSGTDPRQCNLPGVSYIGNVLTGSAILNGYLYIWGGCNNTTSGCADTSRGVMYTSIGSDGSLTRPSSCGTWSSVDSFCYNSTSFPATNGVGAPGAAVANGYIYSIGGFYATGTSSGGMVNNIYYTAPDPTTGAISSWSSVSLTGVGGTSVSYPYTFTRANPTQTDTYPNNLYILGGCTNATGIGCPSSTTGYTDAVYKCNLSPSGVPSGCSENGQLQIGTVPGASAAGLGAAAGTVYANYIYLMGGLTYGNNDLKTTRYAKIDNSNNIVAVSGSGWVESENLTYFGRRRGSGFGYNGYLYVVGGYDGTGGGGVLADIEFAKINVSDGSIGPWNVSTVSIDERWGLGLAVSNSYAYVIGGCINGSAPTCNAGGQTNSIQTFQVYNNDSGTPAGYASASNTYTANPNRIGVSATVLNGYLYVAGGTTGTTDGSNPVANVSYAAIDPNGGLGSWSSTTAALPAARSWGKLLNAGGSLYYVGGQDSDGTSQSTIYYATPSSGNVTSWGTTTAPLPSARTRFGATVWNNRLYIVGGYTGTANQISYDTAGTSTFTVPSGISSVTVKAWGAGGGGGSGSGSTGTGGAGGGGGFAQATLSVTGGTALTLNVGSGGANAAGASRGGSGGGFSAVLNGSTYLIQAGGGGGGGGVVGTSTYYGGAGGAGGGASGTAGSSATGVATVGGAGGAGSTTAGSAGSAGSSGTAGNSGAANLGGDAGGSGTTCTTAVATRGSAGGIGGGGKGGTAASCVSGGGGGSGRFGGGGGGSAINTSNRGSGGGGGGSSLVTGSGTVQTTGSGTTPGNNADTTYNGTAGVGGSGSTSTTSTAGTDGEIVISYGSYTPTNTVYVSPQLNTGGNITGSWTTGSTPFSVARGELTTVAYANNLYILGGNDGTNYLSDTQYAQINSTTGDVSGNWTYSQSLPSPMAGGDGFAVNGYIYLIGGRSSDTVCAPSTLVAPISANTTIATGNNPTGVGVWYATNARYTGNRYGNAAVYNDGKAYVLGGGCNIQTTYASPTVQQTTLLSQPQVAKYSIMFDTDSDVFPNYWLLNGVDNSIGARWQLKYRSMANQQTTTKCAVMTTWGQDTNFGSVTLGQPGQYIVRDGSGTNISCGRYYYFNVTVDSSQAFGYPDDVTRGPTISDLTLQFTADPAKRLMHGRTFIGGLQMPDDTPLYSR